MHIINNSSVSVLIEDVFHLLQLLRIGGYYIIKRHKDDSYCTTNYSNYVGGSKVVVSSKTSLFSFSFSSSDDLLRETDQACTISSSSFFSIKEVFSEESHQIELPIMMFGEACPHLCTDLHLFLPAESVRFLDVNLKLLEQDFVKPSASLEELATVSKFMTESTQSFGTSIADCSLPVGTLISLHGYVVELHKSDKCSLAAQIDRNSSVDGQLLNILKEVNQSLCIHVLVDHHMVIFSLSQTLR